MFELELVEIAHVEHQAVVSEALAAHAVALPGGGHFEVVLAGKLEGVSDVVRSSDLHHAVDRGFVETARVIYIAAPLLQCQRLLRGIDY